MGFKVYYGDATRLELLKAAGCENAKLFIAAIDNPTANLIVIELLKKHFPHQKTHGNQLSDDIAYGKN